MAAFETPVNEITNIDQNFLRAWRQILGIFHDRPVHLDHEIGATMNVADGINADARRNACWTAAYRRLLPFSILRTFKNRVEQGFRFLPGRVANSVG